MKTQKKILTVAGVHSWANSLKTTSQPANPFLVLCTRKCVVMLEREIYKGNDSSMGLQKVVVVAF